MVSSCDWGFDVEQKKMDDRERLRQYFLTLKPEQQVDGWDVMWKQNLTPWDRNQPNPALVNALNEKSDLVGPPFRESGGANVRKKALVPGCGKGYDVLLLSSYGFDAYGLDASPKAIEEAEKVHSAQSKDQKYPVKNIQNGRGDVKFLVTDFFKDDFLSQTHSEQSERTFDLIYDYTFLCALPPSFRSHWATRMSQLLSPTGRLICLEYPLGKDPKLGGPPVREIFCKCPLVREDVIANV